MLSQSLQQLSGWQITFQTCGRALCYFILPFRRKERNYGRGQEEIILLFWKMPNTDSGSGILNSVSTRAKTRTRLCVTTNPIITLMNSKWCKWCKTFSRTKQQFCLEIFPQTYFSLHQKDKNYAFWSKLLQVIKTPESIVTLITFVLHHPPQLHTFLQILAIPITKRTFS